MALARTHIMIHHSLTKDGETVSWAAIEKFHRETNGWSDIGYHAGVEVVTDNPDLAAYQIQALIGRSPLAQASACPQGGMNTRALHVCVIGNFDLVAPSEQVLRALCRRVIVPWMREYGIAPSQIVGHRDYNPSKTCPGKLFDLDLVRRMVT